MTRKASHDSELDHFRGLHSLRPTFGLVLDLIALVQRLETIGLNNRVVHEHIIPTSIRGNESVTLASAEELHSSLCHCYILSLVPMPRTNGRELKTATASPEGSAAANRILSRQRAVALKEYLSGRTDDRTGIDTLIRPRWIGEDWQLLVRKVQQDTEMDDRSAVLDIMSSVKDPDAREAGIRKRFPDAYKHIREIGRAHV